MYPLFRVNQFSNPSISDVFNLDKVSNYFIFDVNERLIFKNKRLLNTLK